MGCSTLTLGCGVERGNFSCSAPQPKHGWEGAFFLVPLLFGGWRPIAGAGGLARCFVVPLPLAGWDVEGGEALSSLLFRSRSAGVALSRGTVLVLLSPGAWEAGAKQDKQVLFRGVWKFVFVRLPPGRRRCGRARYVFILPLSGG